MHFKPYWSVAFADGTETLVARAGRYRCAALARLGRTVGNCRPMQAARALQVEAVSDMRLVEDFAKAHHGRTD